MKTPSPPLPSALSGCQGDPCAQLRTVPLTPALEPPASNPATNPASEPAARPLS